MPFTLTRSLLVILIPGAIATSPWIAFVLIKSSIDWNVLKDLKTELGALCFLTSVIVGGIFEGLNSWIEVGLDNYRTRTFPNLINDWYDYLCLQRDKEPVVFRYISSRATTMYFEFSMAWATPISSYGAACILGALGVVTEHHWLIITVAWLLCAYFLHQGATTHWVLCKIRHELNSRNPARTAPTPKNKSN